jgi:hypothetical protein
VDHCLGIFYRIGLNDLELDCLHESATLRSETVSPLRTSQSMLEKINQGEFHLKKKTLTIKEIELQGTLKMFRSDTQESSNGSMRTPLP